MKRLLISASPIFLAAILGWAVVIFGAYLALGRLPSPEDFIHWDGLLYLDIMKQGYTLFPCTPDLGWPGQWCGNSAWQPLFPWLTQLVALSGLSLPLSGMIIVGIAGLILLIVVGRWARNTNFLFRTLLLCSIACYPGATWAHAFFPMSLLLLFGVLAIEGVRKGSQAWLIGVWSGLAILSHSSGLLIAACAFILLLLRKSMTALLLYAAPIFVAGAAWLSILLIHTGDVRAWWLVQKKYYSSSGNILTKAHAALDHFMGAFGVYGETQFWQSLQTVIVVVIVTLILWPIWKSSLKRSHKIVETIVAGVLGLSPFAIGGNLSVSRNESQVLIARPMLQIHAWAYGLLLLACITVDLFISRDYFLNLIT